MKLRYYALISAVLGALVGDWAFTAAKAHACQANLYALCALDQTVGAYVGGVGAYAVAAALIGLVVGAALNALAPKA